MKSFPFEEILDSQDLACLMDILASHPMDWTLLKKPILSPEVLPNQTAEDRDWQGEDPAPLSTPHGCLSSRNNHCALLLLIPIWLLVNNQGKPKSRFGPHLILFHCESSL